MASHACRGLERRVTVVIQPGSSSNTIPCWSANLPFRCSVRWVITMSCTWHVPVGGGSATVGTALGGSTHQHAWEGEGVWVPL